MYLYGNNLFQLKLFHIKKAYLLVDLRVSSLVLESLADVDHLVDLYKRHFR